jgi:hypothetical protein
MNPKSDAIYAMVRDFRQRGVPIDGVGLQTSRTCRPMSAPFPLISIASPPWECRSILRRWTLPCRSTPTAILAPKTCNSRRTSIARLLVLACLIVDVQRSRHGGSPTSTPGSDRIRRERKVRPCRLIGTTSPSLPTRRCGVCWRPNVVRRSLLADRHSLSVRQSAKSQRRIATSGQPRPIM